MFIDEQLLPNPNVHKYNNIAVFLFCFTATLPSTHYLMSNKQYIGMVDDSNCTPIDNRSPGFTNKIFSY